MKNIIKYIKDRQNIKKIKQFEELANKIINKEIPELDFEAVKRHVNFCFNWLIKYADEEPDRKTRSKIYNVTSFLKDTIGKYSDSEDTIDKNFETIIDKQYTPEELKKAPMLIKCVNAYNDLYSEYKNIDKLNIPESKKENARQLFFNISDMYNDAMYGISSKDKNDSAKREKDDSIKTNFEHCKISVNNYLERYSKLKEEYGDNYTI